MSDYPAQLEIRPLANVPRTTVRVPGSKSITNRALVLAALTPRIEHCLTGALLSEDTEVMIDSLRCLGIKLTAHHAEESKEFGYTPPCFIVPKRESHLRIPTDTADLFVANSGTSMRFLTALVALGNGRYRLDGVPRMRERPISDLLAALTQLGVRAMSETGNGCPPVVIESRGIKGGKVYIKGDTSSQFLSGLLMAAPFAENDLTIEIDGPLVSSPYVDMTIKMMRQFDMRVSHDDHGRYYVPAPQDPYLANNAGRHTHHIEVDATAASYFFGAAAITGGSITVSGTLPERLPRLQGDFRFLDLLQVMGCRIEREGTRITIHGGPQRGIDVDMNDISDTVMTLAAVACFAEGPTTIRNVAHIRHKETDRIAALATELRRIGATVDEFADGLTITPGPLHGAVIETYNDHRMAMSMALIGLKVPGIVIDNPACVAKTYPRFFDDLERLR